MEEAEKVLKDKYEEYKDKPTSYSGYNDEWKKFWTRRYKELRAGNNFILTDLSKIKKC